jgi:hypothetical protein
LRAPELSWAFCLNLCLIDRSHKPLAKPLHTLCVINSHEEPQISEAALKEASVAMQKVTGNLHPGGSAVNTDAVALVKYCNELWKGKTLRFKAFSGPARMSMNKKLECRIAQLK